MDADAAEEEDAEVDDLQESVQLVGKDSLSEDQKCTLEVAKIIREDFLQQNGFTDYDFMCPLGKTIGMMRVIVGFHTPAQKAIGESRAEVDPWSISGLFSRPF